MLKYKKLCFLHNSNLVLYIIIRFNLKKCFHFDAKGIFTMFITTEMFLQKFKQYHPIYPFYKLKNSKIKAPLHYNGKNLKNNYLYLISADDLNSVLQENTDCSYLCIGYPEETEQSKSSSIMYVPQDSDPLEIYTFAVIVFHEFSEFMNKVLDYDNQYSLTEILEEIKNYLDVDTIITGESFNTIAATELYRKESEIAQSLNNAYSLTYVTGIIKNANLNNFEYRDNLYPVKEGSTHSFAYNFKEGNSYIGGILIERKHAPINSGEISLLAVVAAAVERKFKITHTNRVAHANLKKALTEALQNGHVILNDLEQKLTQVGWSMEETFRVIIVRLLEYESSTARNYFAKALEDQHSNCLVFSNEKDLICLECQHKFLNRENDMLQKITDLFKDCNYKVGVSNSGHIKNFVSFVKQCKIAIELAYTPSQFPNSFAFCDCILPYLLTNSLNCMPISEICHPALVILKEYDQQNNSDLLHTLRTYLEQDFHIQRTADHLFIHRTTLLYRLKTIQKLTDVDLHNFQTIIHIGFSYLLMDTSKN